MRTPDPCPFPELPVSIPSSLTLAVEPFRGCSKEKERALTHPSRREGSQTPCNKPAQSETGG